MSEALRAAIRDGRAMRQARDKRRAGSIPCDSPEGAQIMMDAARAGRLVLGSAHRAIAIKHGVSIEGVLFNDQPRQ